MPSVNNGTTRLHNLGEVPYGKHALRYDTFIQAAQKDEHVFAYHPGDALREQPDLHPGKFYRVYPGRDLGKVTAVDLESLYRGV